jgi:hypothetical protein
MQMNHDQWRRLQLLLCRDEYNRDNYSSPSTGTHSSTHGEPQLKGAMSYSAKRIKLTHDDAGRDSQQVRHPWDGGVGSLVAGGVSSLNPVESGSDFIPKPLLPPEIFIDISLMSIPPEVLFQILHSWLGPQHLSVTEITTSILPRYQLSYTSPSNSDPWSLMAKVPNFPPHLLDEYLRFRLLSWLKDRKEFEDPYTFYMSHFLLCYAGELGGKKRTTTSYNLRLETAHAYQVPNTPCWDALNSLAAGITVEVQLPVLSPSYAHLSHLHGLEKIKLDFTAEQYFAFFDVAVPPFNTHATAVRGDDLYRDPLCHGAAIFLAHTKSLTLHFGTKYKASNAWSNVSAAPWCTENSEWEYKEARLRNRVCQSGVMVDWILSYAWYGNFLQGIEKVSISGDVQEWVRCKWYKIFEEHTEYKKKQKEKRMKVDVFGVHRPDVVGIETYGKAEHADEEGDDDAKSDADFDMSSEDEAEDDDAADEEDVDVDEDGGEVEYRPQDHYPPACTCAIGCWRLRGGKVDNDDFPVKSSWDEYPGEVQGCWMDGLELGTAAHW